MNNLIKFCGFSILITLTLSIRVQNRTIFGHIYPSLSTLTIPAQKELEFFFNKGAKSTVKISTEIFENSLPKLKSSVRSSLAKPIEKSNLQNLSKNHKIQSLISE